MNCVATTRPEYAENKKGIITLLVFLPSFIYSAQPLFFPQIDTWEYRLLTHFSNLNVGSASWQGWASVSLTPRFSITCSLTAVSIMRKQKWKQ